ncbi:hypothetical protein D3C72_2190020 [compost metagenome]
MRRLLVISACHHRGGGRRLDANVDIFRETADEAIALRKRGAALQFEGEFQLLQAIEALHDPVVLLHQGGRDALVVGDDPDQI